MRRNMINPQRMRKLAYLSYLLGIFFIVVSLALSAAVSPATANNASSLNENSIAAPPGECGPYDVKIENGPPWSYTTPNGELIKKVTIKAGAPGDDACFSFVFPPENQEGTCYRVTGLGTTSINATKIGPGPDCKDISHIEITFMDEEPTPTFTNTPEEPTPTFTNTPEEPTPTFTNTPEEPTPTFTNTPEEPTPTFTNTPEEPTPTFTNTPEEPTPTFTNTPEGPTPTFTNTPEEPTPTETTSPEPPDTVTPEPSPTDTATLEPTPTDTEVPPEEPEPTDTTVPTLPAPTSDTGSEVLIPVTGIDLGFQQTIMVRIFSNLGLVFFGIGIVLHGLSLRMKEED